jgi:hypothetical protein
MSDPTPSRWDDYLDVYIAPKRLFERRSDGKFGHALLVFLIASILLFAATRTAMEPIMMAEFERGMASNPNLTPEQLEQARGFAPISFWIFLVVGTPIMVFGIGAMIWIAAKAIGRSLSYAQSATIAVFAVFPRLVEHVLNGLQALLMDEQSLVGRYSVSIGPGRLLDPGDTLLLAFLGRLDLFTLWVTALIFLGLKVVGRASTGQALAGAGLVWLLGALPALVQALRAG